MPRCHVRKTLGTTQAGRPHVGISQAVICCQCPSHARNAEKCTCIPFPTRIPTDAIRISKTDSSSFRSLFIICMWTFPASLILYAAKCVHKTELNKSRTRGNQRESPFPGALGAKPRVKSIQSKHVPRTNSNRVTKILVASISIGRRALETENVRIPTSRA